MPNPSAVPGLPGPRGANIIPDSEQTKQDYYDAMSGTFGGRGISFDRALAASPYYRSVNPWARSVLENQGNRLQTQYALSGDNVGDFRTWLQGRGANPFGGQDFDFTGRLGEIQSQGFLPGQDQSLLDWQNSRGDQANPYQTLLDDEQLGFATINQISGRGINPALRRGYQGSVRSGIDAWRDQNPEQSVFGEFARRGFRWG